MSSEVLMQFRFNSNLTVSLLSLALSTAFAHGDGAQKAQKVLTDAKVDQSFIKLNVKPAINFVPLPMVDRNGKPIDPNQTAKLPDGSTITAREYFAQLNAYEQKLNK